MKKVINIENEFKFHNKDTIVIGCSAGPDSMALLDMLVKIRNKYDLDLICCHVNHNLRKQSVEEANFTKEYCKKHKIHFEYMLIEKYGDDNFHNEARNIRYKFFDEIAIKYNADYVMTAHHGDDLIETILMRITRGSNINGYSGFKREVVKDEYKIIRPLITFTKEELEEYNHVHKVPYYIDHSNEEDKYTRNRYRKTVLPFLKQEDKNVHLKFLKFSEDLAEMSKYIKKERDKVITKVFENDYLLIDQFLLLDEYMQNEILSYLLSEFYQDDLILLGNKHIELLRRLVLSSSSKANMQVNLPNEVIAVKNYNKLILKRGTEELTEYEIELSDYVVLPNKHTLEMIRDTSENSNHIIRLDSKEISLPLIVRTRKLGDRMDIKGLNGSRKIKDIFIDKKIPLQERDLWPVVVDSMGKVIFIPGIKKSKFDKKKTDSYDIIIKYC